MRVYTRIYTYIHIYTHIYSYIYVYTRIYIYIHVYTRIYTCRWPSTSLKEGEPFAPLRMVCTALHGQESLREARICAYIHVYARIICTYIHVYTRIYTYIHVYTRTGGRPLSLKEGEPFVPLRRVCTAQECVIWARHMLKKYPQVLRWAWVSRNLVSAEDTNIYIYVYIYTFIYLFIFIFMYMCIYIFIMYV